VEICRPAGILILISPIRSVPCHTGSECSLLVGPPGSNLPITVLITSLGSQMAQPFLI
jgi:hypothetical protein